MAEAVVENRPPPVRFFCHKCNIEFEHVLQDYTCPFCAMGFIEELEESNIIDGMSSIRSDNNETTNTNNTQPFPCTNIFAAGDEPFDVDMTVLNDFSNRESNTQDNSNSNDSCPRWQPPWNYRDPNRTQSDSPHFVNLNDFAFLSQNAQNNSPLSNNPPQGGALSRESMLLQLVHQIVLGAESDGHFVVLGSRRMGGNLEGALGGIMSGEGLDAIMSQLLWQVESEGPPPLPAQAIASLPEVNITQEQVNQGLQCSICWETFQTDEKVRELSCGHLYHQDCITPWLSLHATCPICRKSLAPPAPTTPPPDTPSQEQSASNSATHSHTPQSLAFLFRACGVPTPSTSTSNPNNLNNSTSDNTNNAACNNTTSNSTTNTNTDTTNTNTTTQPPRGSMSHLLNQLVSMSGALGLNFNIGGGPPTVTTTNPTSHGNNTSQRGRQPPPPPPPPSNYDSDMDFD